MEEDGHLTLGETRTKASDTRGADSNADWEALSSLIIEDAKSLSSEHPHCEVELPIAFDFEATLLQYCLSMGYIQREHVALLSLTRLLLRAIHQEHLVPAAKWDVLKRYNVTQQTLLGRQATYLSRGRADGAAEFMGPSEYVRNTNSGNFSVSTIKSESPLASSAPGPKEEDYLNLFEAARAHGGKVSYHPTKLGQPSLLNPSVLVTVAFGALDGMLIKQGHMTDEQSLCNIGSLDHPVSAAEAQKLIAMSDEERRKWLSHHPYINEYVEVMATFADGSVHGHLGFEFAGKGGGAESVASVVDKYIKNCRVCFCCLKSAFEGTSHDTVPGAGWALAKSTCDKYCEDCMEAETASFVDHAALKTCSKHTARAGSHWTSIQCERCTKESEVCHNISLEGFGMDCCGSQEAYQAQVVSRKAGMYGTGDHIAVGDLAHLTKTVVLGCMNHWIRYEGHYVGVRQLISVFFDEDSERRRKLRNELDWRDLEGKNKYDVQGRVNVASVPAEVLLTTEEIASDEPVHIVTVVAPERRFFWRENPVSSVNAPGGLHFDEVSGIVIYVEQSTNALFALRLGHCPAYNDLLLCKGSTLTSSFIDVALLNRRAYVTDGRAQCLWTVDLERVLTPNRSAGAGTVDDGDDTGTTRGAQMPASSKFTQVRISFQPGEHWPILSLHAIIIDEHTSTAYVTDIGSRSVYCFVFSSPTAAVVTRLCQITGPTFRESDEPRGLAFLGVTTLVVTVSDKLLLVHRSGALRGTFEVVHTSDPPTVDCSGLDPIAAEALRRNATVQYYGVSVNRDSSIVRVTSDKGKHGIWEFNPGSWIPTLICGGNIEFSGLAQGQEGTARAILMYRPSFGCFAFNSFVFSHPGVSSVALMTNLRILATVLLPNMRKVAEAGGLADSNNATDIHEGYIKLRQVDAFVDKVQSYNTSITGRPGGQGNEGCWSNNFRRAVKSFISSIEIKLQQFAERKLPVGVVSAMSLSATLTLCVESYFPVMRSALNSGGGNPYALQCSRRRASVNTENAKSLTENGFSYFTGPTRHYVPTGSSPAAMIYMRDKSCVSAGTLISAEQRIEQLRVLRLCQKLFRGARTGRVTDHGKHSVGTAPTQSRPGFTANASDSRGPMEPRQHQSAAGVQAGCSRILYYANAIIVVKIVHPGQSCPFQLVHLRENLVETWTKLDEKRARRTGNSYEWVAESWNPLVVDFYQDEDDSNHFRTSQPPAMRRLCASAFYGVVDSYFSASMTDGELSEFYVTDETYEEAVSLVCALPSESSVRSSVPSPIQVEEAAEGDNSSDDDSRASKRHDSKRQSERFGMRPRAGAFDVVALGLITSARAAKGK